MNRKQILAFTRAEGYTGPADLTALKAWLDAQKAEGKEFQFKDAGGNPIDIDKAWANVETKAFNAPSSADPGDTDPSQADTDTKIAKLEADLQAMKVKANRGTGFATIGHVNGDEPKAPAVHTGRAVEARKAYKRLISDSAGLPADKKAVFDDADKAEVFGAFMRLAIVKVAGRDVDYAEKATDRDIVGKALLTTVNTAAGVLIPEDYIPQVIDLAESYGVARKIANVQRMGRDVVQRPRLTSDVTMSHTGENVAGTSTDPAFDLVTLTAKKVMGVTTVSNEMLEDSAVSIGDVLARTYSRAYANRVDSDYFLGDGTSTYGGHVGLATNLPASAYYSGSGNSWAGIVAADLDKAPGLIENADVNRCVFVSSRQFYYTRVAALDTAASQFKALAGPGINGSDASYKGWPWYFAQVLPTTSASGSKIVYFGDFAAATMLGERRDFSIEASEHVAFTSDAMTFRATARLAVNIHGDGRGSTYGPVLCLKTT